MIPKKFSKAMLGKAGGAMGVLRKTFSAWGPQGHFVEIFSSLFRGQLPISSEEFVNSYHDIDGF